MRSTPIRVGVAGLMLMSVLGCNRGRVDRPPILVISIDTMRADRLPDWGHRAGRTPQISSLVRDGVRFENAYAQVPLTLPSHVSMFTGLLPPLAGVRSNIGYRFDASAHRTIPGALRSEAGYATGAAVSSYVLRREAGLATDFDFYDDAMEVSESSTLGALQRIGPETVDAALRWLASVPEEQPYFLFVHLFEPHFPYEPPASLASAFEDPYDGEIAAADAALESLLAALRRRGDYERSLVILLSDHGEGLGDHGEREHGLLLYRESLHVPLVLKLPNQERSGSTVSEPVGLFDLFPTIAEMVGIAGPAEPAGQPLLRVRGDRSPPRRIYSETLYPRLHLGWSELRSLVDERHHAIVGPDPELYDLLADPAERRNLRLDRRREYAEMAEELSRIPLDFEPPPPASSEEMARLAALGYLGGSAVPTTGPLPDPKANLGLIDDIQRTFALTSAGRYQEALALCVQLLGEHPDLVDVRNQLAGILRKLGRAEEALAVYDETDRRYPQLSDSLAIERAKIELDLGRLDRAEAALVRARTANPLEAHLIAAAIAGRRGNWELAVTESRAGVGDTERPRLPALLLLSQALGAQGKLDDALLEIERAVAHLENNGAAPVPTVHSTRGDLLARLGRAAEAERAFRRELALFPGSSDPYVKLAILMASEHRFEEIEPTLEAMVQAIPTRPTYELAADTMRDLGNASGEESFRRRGRGMKRNLLREPST